MGMLTYQGLMVGDWVRFKENYPQKELQGKIAKVKGVRGRIDVRTQDGEYYESEHPDWLDPIPLTEDILVKNGFGKVNNQYFFGQVEIKELRDCWVVIINKEDADIDINIHYVHQLQHLLRLCGIEKEITI